MAPALPGSLPSWITPSRLVILAQVVGLSFLVALSSVWLSLSLWAGFFLWGVAALLFFGLAWLTGGQGSWIAVAASYGELGAWLGSLTSVAFFVFSFVSDARSHESATLFSAMICAALLGWLPGLLVGLGASALFWALGGWLLASVEQHRAFPAHDDVHQGFFRVGGWFWALGLFGLWVAPSSLLWAAGLGLSLSGIGLGVAAFRGLRRRAEWLREVRAGRVSRWALRPEVSLYTPLRPLSNRDAEGLLLVYRVDKNAPYRSHEEDLPVALY